MRALDREVKDAVWAAVAALLPQRPDSHPLGTHRRRVPDRVCFEGILVRLVTGCSWQTAERLLGCSVSDTTLRARRDEWIEAGVFDAVVEEASAAFDRIVGLDLADVAVDGSARKAPCGGPGAGRNPTDRGKSGPKWSLLCDAAGIPVGWAADGANRHDQTLFDPTLAAAAGRGLLEDVETLHLAAATTAAPSGPAPPRRASTTSSAPADDPPEPPHTKPPPHWGCDGPSNAPTHSCRTSADSPQHRPAPPPPTRPTRLGHRPTHLHQTHRLAKPLVTTYPLTL